MTKPTNILLIEDDARVRQALGNALAVEFYHVVLAANRQEALREFGREQFDLVLLDLNPAHENAWETLERLTSAQPHLPVIAMTARPEQPETDARAQNVDVLMEKPLNLSLLFQNLEILLASPRHRVPSQQTYPTRGKTEKIQGIL